MEFWLTSVLHVLLQYADITEVMLYIHNDLNSVCYANFYVNSTKFWKCSLQVARR